MQEHERTRKRLAALAAFAAFWAALLVVVGFPFLLVAAAYLVAVVAVASAFEGRRAFAALRPRVRQAAGGLRGAVASGSRTVASLVERIDWRPLRAGGVRAAALGAGAARRVAATGSAAAAAASVRTAAIRQDLGAARDRRAARTEAERLNARAATLRQQGELDGALAAGERALVLLRGLGDRRAEALTLNGLGLTQARLGDEASAVDSYETAVAILTELGDSHGAGRVLANLGALHLDLGREDEARARWTDALERLEPGSPEHERTAAQLRLSG